MKKVYLIKDITEYGKFISFCIEHDITVFRTYWFENSDTCYYIDFEEKRCFYSRKEYYECNGYKVIIPEFELDRFGHYEFKID